MQKDNLKIEQSPIYQKTGERIPYFLTTTPWGSSPSSPSVTIKNAAGVDVTADHTTGDATVSGDVITTPVIHSLKVGQKYLLEISFVTGGATLVPWADLYGV